MSHHWDWESGGCACGSEWNHYENGCSFEYPLRSVVVEDRTIEDYPDSDPDHECSHGHIHCYRH